MNIFILSYKSNWDDHMAEQARSHCDKHIIKMITESVQMLSTNLAVDETLQTVVNGHPAATLAAYGNHPCTRWARESIHNFTYLTELALTLCVEKLHRYPLKPPHMYHAWLAELRGKLFTYEKVPALFPIAIPDSDQATKLTGVCVNLDTAADLYQRYYVTRKGEFATWKNRPIPVWFLIEQEIFNAKKGI